MTGSTPPSVPRPAGDPDGPDGDGARSGGYVESDQPRRDPPAGEEFEAADDYLAGPQDAPVAVFQPPQPARPRAGGSAPRLPRQPDPLDDIDSPFLDLVSSPSAVGGQGAAARPVPFGGSTGPAGPGSGSASPAGPVRAPGRPVAPMPRSPHSNGDGAPGPEALAEASGPEPHAAPDTHAGLEALAGPDVVAEPEAPVGAETSGTTERDTWPDAFTRPSRPGGPPPATDPQPAPFDPPAASTRSSESEQPSGADPSPAPGPPPAASPPPEPLALPDSVDDFILNGVYRDRNGRRPAGVPSVDRRPKPPAPFRDGRDRPPSPVPEVLAPAVRDHAAAVLPAAVPIDFPAVPVEGDEAPPANLPAPRRLGGKRQAVEKRASKRPVQPRKPPPRPGTGKLKFNDRDPATELAITEIAGHLTFTPNTVTAWYWLPEVRWAFRPDAEREALLSAISEQYAGLAGFRLHLRRTTRPFPADEWARTIDANTIRPLPAVEGGTSWADHLVAAQRHLLSVNHAEGQTYLGVTFARRSLGDSLAEKVLRVFGRGVAEGERRRLSRMVEQFDEVLGSFGMRGRQVTPSELEWLLYRSVALCMSPPTMLSPVKDGEWERGDLLALTEQIERYRSPYGSTVKLVNRMTGEERHVAVLTVGRMEPLEIPERHEPWLHFHERLPWPMELSSRMDLLGPGDSFRNLEHRLRMIRSQQLDYAEHGIDAPPELERLAKRALVIGDEMTTGLPVESARAHGWHRIAVGGRSREECLERARRVIQLYSRELRVSLQHPKNQDWLAREFIPGEPIANTGYVRRMPVKLLAAALPQAASTVGDRRGDLIGRTAGTCRRPVFLDMHFPMEIRERSGLAVFVAEPGGGKSTLLGALGYLAARRGVQVTLLDPSGPLARLCAMPELRPFSRVLNLTGSEQGTLAPYSLIPTPRRTEFPAGSAGDREYEIAVSNARAERRMLVQDICSMLVPPQVAREASTATLLRHAVRQVPAEETSTLDDVVACLQGLADDDARELANLLLDTAEMPLALLFFGSPQRGLLGADATLTVITMAGLRLPDLKIEREYWSAEEALALPMLHTAHRLAVRRSYGGDMSSRKLVGLDEAHFMEGWRSGRSFLVRLARDSRKWNLAALVASQNPRDILGLDVQNLVSTVFVGRIAEDPEIAAEALRLLRVPVDDGYEQVLAGLSMVDASSAQRLGFREFVMRDVDGRVQKVRVDVSYVAGLLDHLDTTPAVAEAPSLPAAGATPDPLTDSRPEA